jgi:hypothetical protein
LRSKERGASGFCLILATADASAAQSVQPIQQAPFIQKTAGVHAVPWALYLW